MKIDIKDINVNTVILNVTKIEAELSIKNLLLIIYELRDICDYEVNEDVIETTSGDVHLNDLRLRDNGENSAPYTIRST